jgi:E3 ubiquitin-protein ligase HERC2
VHCVSLPQTHQEQGRSYKEVCAPVIERLRFLFNELRPAASNDLSIVSKLKLLSSQPRWKKITQKLIRDRRKKKGGWLVGMVAKCANPPRINGNDSPI